MGRQEGRNKVGLLLRQRRIVLAVGVGCGQDFGVGAADGHRSGLSSRDLVVLPVSSSGVGQAQALGSLR
jgi:hypothetical protein